MVVMLQGFIVLFSGAMTYVIAPQLARVLGWIGRFFSGTYKSGAAHG
jgi:simple sugar transport system permease protein